VILHSSAEVHWGGLTHGERAVGDGQVSSASNMFGVRVVGAAAFSLGRVLMVHELLVMAR
jgi:hypothetical protein